MQYARASAELRVAVVRREPNNAAAVTAVAPGNRKSAMLMTVQAAQLKVIDSRCEVNNVPRSMEDK